MREGETSGETMNNHGTEKGHENGEMGIFLFLDVSIARKL